MGASTIAGERERGTLEHLLAQPLSRSGLLLGKHAGLLAALASATAIGFVPAGVLIVFAAGPGLLAQYVLFPAIAILAAAALAGVGLWISVSSRSAVQAQGTAVVVWFALALLYDLLIIGSLATGGLPLPALVAALFANPIDAARVLGVLVLEPDLYLLGPAGAWLTTELSPGGTAGLLLAAIAAWACLPVAAAVFRFSFVLERKRSYDSYGIRAARLRRRSGGDHRVRVGRGVASL
jgi:ABC-type transport system involved in multi-copper enzyme maturation permease subunit